MHIRRPPTYSISSDFVGPAHYLGPCRHLTALYPNNFINAASDLKSAYRRELELIYRLIHLLENPLKKRRI